MARAFFFPLIWLSSFSWLFELSTGRRRCLCCRRLDVFLWPVFKLLAALLGAEEKFPAGKHGLDFPIVVIDDHSANGVNVHGFSFNG
jgi:hypothetical protein